MRQTVKAVIFDQDGLMFDTERISGIAWQLAGKEFGFCPEESFLKTIRGTNREQMRSRFEAVYGTEIDFERFRDRKQQYYEAQFAKEGVPVKPGLRELLAFLKEQRIPMAVATASKLDYTERNLRETGLGDYFDYLVTGEMVSRAKPDPALFMKAAELLGKRPEECLVLEDSLNGVEAGLTGGFRTIMVPDLTQPDEELASRVYRVCGSLLEVKELLQEELSVREA